jgi:tetratricopeptide (TPR) repeat protein/outer membrane protein assembly factor BamB
LVAVFEGIVATSNAHGSLDLNAGQSAMARPGEAPEPFVMVRPRDAVQWALYYPPILALHGDSSDSARPFPEAIERALADSSRGDTAGAFARLDAVPERERGALFHLVRAALLLNVGQVDEAALDIDTALAKDPDASLAYALRAVIAVAQNDTERALADGRRAVELSPRSAPALIALSYAEQSSFRLEAARDTLLKAVEAQPQDALAWARLAELWLALGYRRQALEAAGRASELAPDLSRTEIVHGFAALAAFRPVIAKEAFERAIRLDSADPLSHFGLGLAEIRQSNLKKGRKQIEIAVGMDPNNALLRASLGKAFFEQRATSLGAYLDVLEAQFTGEGIDLAGEQFAIAKKLDPNDPTPWFYDAILKQSENRPVEALREIEEAIRLNDNRAVFRSRELLDEDRAARGASLARIYDDLGFEQLGINEAAKSLSLDPASSSSHRLLSDVYAALPRREVARVSELLQAQLLQDININPVQPSLSSTNLDIFTGGGPTTPGLGEYTPLFERNRAQLNMSGQVGNQNTHAAEGVISGVYDQFSVSVGQFAYKTDGFRRNYDLEHYITDVFTQVALSPEVNVQAEVLARRTENGDRFFNFNQNNFSRSDRYDIDQDMGRFGVRISPTPSSDLIGSVIVGRRHQKLKSHGIVFDPFLGIIPVTTRNRINDDGVQGEGEYLWRHGALKGLAGAGVYGIQRQNRFTSSGETVFRQNENIDAQSGFFYVNAKIPTDVTWTIGSSIDHYHQTGLTFTKLNPKAGVQWQIVKGVEARAAAFRTVKPPLIAERTIRPTQVAGFNQTFDDSVGTEAWRYGVGLDIQFSKEIKGGFEVSHRSFSEIVFQGDNMARDNRDENLYQVYMYWTPHDQWALSGEFIYDQYRSNQNIDTSVPEKVTTLSLPVSARFFSPTGLFAGVTGTFVHQDVQRRTAPSDEDGNDNFFVVNLGFGYRLPQRRGLIGLEVGNVFDTSVSYQDDGFRQFRDSSADAIQPTASPFIPERTFMARVTLNF